MQTPQILAKKIAKNLELPNAIYLKREDRHPLGSHKGRSLPNMIDKYIKNGWQNFVISSSGNAAVAAAKYIRKYNQQHKNKISLQIFVGENVDLIKLSILKKLSNENIIITKTKNPKQEAFKLDKNKQFKILRQSTDDTALIGYQSLADELLKIKKLAAVFIPTSSGTTAQGLHLAFNKRGFNPQIHIAQTTACHPIVAILNPAYKKIVKSSLAGAIVDKIAHRKIAVIKAIKESNGDAYIIDNSEIKNAIKLGQKEKIKISPNSALSIAALQQALQAKKTFSGPVVCLITGR